MKYINIDTALILAVQIITIGLIIQNMTTFIFILVGISLFFMVIKEQQKQDKKITEQMKKWKKKLR